MDIDDDDDFYGSNEEQTPAQEQKEAKSPQADAKAEVKSPKAEDSPMDGAEDDEEAEEEDDDSDIEIVTERKDGTKAAPAPTAKYNEIRNIAQRTASNEVTKKPVAPKKEKEDRGSVPVAGAEMPAERTSTVDVDAKPIYKPAGKPITQVDIDTDLPEENERPWRRPGTDISDYFNYGFDEFTWALYAQKQESLRSEFDQNKIAENQKKMMEDMSMMMGMGGMPGMPAMPGMPPAAAGGMGMPGMPGMPGMDGNMPPEMQAMMQQMMAGGMDPSQMDPSMFGGAGMPGQGAQAGAQNAQGGNQNAGFGGQQQYGQGNQQNYGYDQAMGGAGEGGQGQGQGHSGGRGNFRGRGRGRGNRW